MKLIKKLTLLFLTIIMLFPFVFVVIGSTQDAGWAFRTNIDFKLGSNFLENYNYIKNHFYIDSILINSLYIAIITACFSVIIVFLAAYAFNKYKFKFRNIFLVVFMTSVFIPQAGLLVGQLKTMVFLGVYGTIVGLIVPFIVNIRVYIYLFQVCNYIPNDLIESGRIDGASEFKIMLLIGIPCIIDKLLFSFFILFVGSWNNFLIPMIMVTKGRNYTIPILISSLSDPLSYNTGSTFLALLLSIVPITIIFFLFSNKVFNINKRIV